MGNSSSIRQFSSVSRTRILLICPQCSQEHVESSDTLRGARFYPCAGEGCDYRFDLAAAPRRNFTQGLADAWRRLYAALMPAS